MDPAKRNPVMIVPAWRPMGRAPPLAILNRTEFSGIYGSSPPTAGVMGRRRPWERANFAPPLLRTKTSVGSTRASRKNGCRRRPSMGMPTFPVSLPSHCAARACVVCGGFVPSTEGWPELFISSPAVCAFLRSNRAGRGGEFCRQFVHAGTCGSPTP